MCFSLNSAHLYARLGVTLLWTNFIIYEVILDVAMFAPLSNRYSVCRLQWCILAELDRLGISNYYETIEISVLGHYQQFSVKNTCNALHFICLYRSHQ